MAAHGIIDNGDGTFSLAEDATDFNYFVQIGNKGTWSIAAVDVTVPEPEPCSEENIVTNSTFEVAEGTVPPAGWVGDAIINGWTNTGDANDGGIEVWSQSGVAGLSALLPPVGDFVIETDGWGNGPVDPVTLVPVIDNIKTEVNAVEGQEYELTFNYGARTCRAETPTLTLSMSTGTVRPWGILTRPPGTAGRPRASSFSVTPMPSPTPWCSGKPKPPEPTTPWAL